MTKETDKKRKKRKPFRHLKQSDRDRIEALLDVGHTQKEIATILQFDPGAISREIKRKQKDGHYVATVAQHKAGVKRSNSKYQGMKIERYPDLRADIIALLKQLRSPDEIAGRMKLEKRKVRVNANAIYKWLQFVKFGGQYCLVVRGITCKSFFDTGAGGVTTTGGEIGVVFCTICWVFC